MFTFFCTNCGAKLVVKDETLIGRIVPCPQCGTAVLVHPSGNAPAPKHETPEKPVVHKRFPNLLTHETASGIIGHSSKVNLRAETFLDASPQDPDVSETEVKTRKMLVGFLLGLSAVLLLALGFLIVFQKPEQPQSQEPPPVGIEPAEPAEKIGQIEKIDIVEIDAVLPIEEPAELSEPLEIVPMPMALAQDTPVGQESSPDEHIQTPDDILSAFEQHMPGLLDTFVPDIDIDARLALPILEANFDQQSLIEFVRDMSPLTGIPMTLDIDEMTARSLSVKTPVSGQFSEATAEEILTQTLATLDMQWIAADRQILISPKETADAVDLTFDVSDFVERTDDLTPEVLAEMVHKLVVPEATVAVLAGNRLGVVRGEQPSRKSLIRKRDKIQRFLEQLRTVRQLPPKTALTGETLAPEAFGWDRVMEPMTLNHYQAVPLSRIIAQLESMTDLTIIVDHQSLHRALTPFASVQATVQCDRGTVSDALELSLASVDLVALTYRIVDHQTLEITTMESARQPEKMQMEVHRYELLSDETPEDIVRTLRSVVFADSWAVPEFPETRYGGDIVIDRPSSCLFVRQSQPAQRQIRFFLSMPELFVTVHAIF